MESWDHRQLLKSWGEETYRPAGKTDVFRCVVLVCPISMCPGLMKTWSFVRQVCIFKELRKALSFLQATYHSLSISELDSSNCESWCSLSFLTSCSVAYSRVRKRFRLCKGIELPVNTFSSWQLQWWSQLWVEYPAWNLKGRCTCTFITFRDGNDSLAIGKYLADSGCRNMFRLSKCSKPIPPDGQLTPMSYVYTIHTVFHAQWEQAQLCSLWLSFDVLFHICHPVIKFAKFARWNAMMTPPNGCWCNFWKYNIFKIAGGFMVEEKDSWYSWWWMKNGPNSTSIIGRMWFHSSSPAPIVQTQLDTQPQHFLGLIFK